MAFLVNTVINPRVLAPRVSMLNTKILLRNRVCLYNVFMSERNCPVSPCGHKASVVQ
jgi:hypothetical protein